MAEIIEPGGTEPRPEPEGGAGAAGSGAPRAPLLERLEPWIGQAVAAGLFLIAAYFFVWFLITNQALWIRPHLGGVFRGFAGEWVIGEMDWRGLRWAVGSAAFLLALGWFFLETLELYVPRTALAALALACGMGVAGIALEWIAISQYLTRPVIVVALGVVLAALWLLAWRAGQRPPETGGPGEGGFMEQAVRRDLERKAYAATIIMPRGAAAWLFSIAAVTLITLITAANFYHAVLFPETYWDSLILYLGYARMMFFKHGIVQKVVGQVGIGLGANYPHLYSLLGAGASVLGGAWSEWPQRLLAPMAGLGTLVLVFHTTLRLTRNFNLALAATLIYRSIPLGLAYDQYASDYALTILFAAAMLYVALMYIETGLRGYFLLATALLAFSLHVNFLMGALFVPWAMMVVLAHWRMPTLEDEDERERSDWRPPEQLVLLGPPGIVVNEPTPWSQLRGRIPLWRFVRTPRFLIPTVAWALVGSTWFIRNQIVTGNPVYAFFHEIFGGIHINPEVMDSAVNEWTANGGGIGMFGDTAGERLAGAWAYFVDWKLAYRWQPFFTGFAITGGLVWLARVLAAPFIYRREPAAETLAETEDMRVVEGPGRPVRFVDVGLRVGFIAFTLAALLLGYHFIMAPYYLYQIIMVLPALAVLMSFALPYWRRRGWRWAFGALALAIGVVPGLAMSLMGWKVMRPVRIGPERAETQVDLFALRHPLPDTETMYRWQFGEDALMWRFMKEKLKGEKVLTHENRHLVFDPTIELVHLDDWSIQQLWPRSAEEKTRELQRMGIRFYLRTPNEKNHPINAKMGTEQWEKLGLMRLVAKYGDNELYLIEGH